MTGRASAAYTPAVLPRAALVLCLLAACAPAASAEPRVPGEIVRAGTLRIAIAPTGVALTRWRRDEDEIRGIAPELSEALAERIGVTATLKAYADPVELVLQSSRWDVAFMAVEPAFDDLDFVPFAATDWIALVPRDSPFAAVSQLDRSNVRIAVVRGSRVEGSLSLKKATVVRADDAIAALGLLRAERVHAVADSRYGLLNLPEPIAEWRVLDGRLGATTLAIAVPKERTRLADYVRAFAADAKATGLVQRVLDHSAFKGLRVAR